MTTGDSRPTGAALRVFSYLPNPRVWKAEIAADLGGVEIDVRGAKPPELGTWLWDFDAQPLPEEARRDDHPAARVGRRGFRGTLFKSDAFLAAHPFGTVPAAFSPDGTVGVFESNSILRAAARVVEARSGVQLYGSDLWEASRIDSFLDANLVFARESQVWLLALGSREFTEAMHARMQAAWTFWMDGLEAVFADGADFLVGGRLSIADISFVCDLAQFLREQHYARRLAELELQPVSATGVEDYPHVFARLDALSARPSFAERLLPYLSWRNEG